MPATALRQVLQKSECAIQAVDGSALSMALWCILAAAVAWKFKEANTSEPWQLVA